MNYLIFSDSHGAWTNMKTVIERQNEHVDGIIFLGDNYPDIENIAELYPMTDIYAVAGNCDFSAKYLSPVYRERMIDLNGIRVLIVHGHMQSVKSTTAHLEAYARGRGADIVLFGHTHERFLKYSSGGEKPLYMFNPGSISRPRDGERSFGVLSIRRGMVLLSHGTL